MQLTHAVMEKELKRCHSFDRLEVTDGVRTKAKEFIDKYMSRSGPVFNKASAHAHSAAKLNATMPWPTQHAGINLRVCLRQWLNNLLSMYGHWHYCALRLSSFVSVWFRFHCWRLLVFDMDCFTCSSMRHICRTICVWHVCERVNVYHCILYFVMCAYLTIHQSTFWK